MAGDIRRILDTIEPSRLRAICEERGLPTGGDQYDKRERLSRSMRGEIDELLPLLRRSELVAYLSGDFEWPSGTQGSFTRLGQASRQQLEKLIRWVVRDDPRACSSSRPLGRDCVIRFWRDDDNSEDLDDDESDESDEADDGDPYAAEKVFRAGLKREDGMMYYIKGGDIWAVPRKRRGEPQGNAVRLVSAGIEMDYAQYLYYLDGDGDIARKRRRIRGEEADDEDTDGNEEHAAGRGDAAISKIAHGDIVAARWHGDVHEPARVIRVDPESGDVLVHWYDDKFSDLAAADILRMSDKPWLLEKLGEDEVTLEDEVANASPDEAFLAWLDEYFQTRQHSSLLIKTLVNRLGRYTANQRLTTQAVVDLGGVLAHAGYLTEPDLRSFSHSPGIGARVEVRRGSTASKPSSTTARNPPKPLGPQKPSLSTFEKAALRLQFLVQNAAAIRRQDEAERRRAVELATRDLSLGAADQIRLRALAHQYSSTHSDLAPIVAQLATLLVPEQRRQLLDDLREMCPPGDDIDGLVAAYASDLGIPPVEPPEPGPSPVSEPSAGNRADQPPPASDPVVAGAVRSNSLLDSLFGEEN